MTRDELMNAVVQACATSGAALFTGNGSVARGVSTLHDRPEFFYMVGSMGLCAPIAAGFSNRSDVPVVALEGDANLLMGMSGLPAVARATSGRHFVHVVADNGQCETTGGQRSLSDGVDICRVAIAAGYDHCATATDGAQVTSHLDRALSGGGRWMIHAPVVPATSPKHARVALHPSEVAQRFRTAAAAQGWSARDGNTDSAVTSIGAHANKAARSRNA